MYARRGAREPGKPGFRAQKSRPRYSRSIYRAATAALVEKQSSEMLELINEARSEYMLQESLYLDEGDGYAQEAPPPPYPSRAPPPQPPALAKYHIYNDPLEFADMDQIAISVSLRREILPAPVPAGRPSCPLARTHAVASCFVSSCKSLDKFVSISRASGRNNSFTRACERFK